MRSPRTCSRRQQKRHSKAVQHAQVDGQCVWNALLAGIVGLDANGPTTHAGLLKVIRNRFAKHSSSGIPICIRWQGSSLSQKEIEECQTTVAQISIGDGHLCGACDPLLVAYVVAFQVNVTHIFGDHTFDFEIDDARRHVHLRSSSAHMEHVANCDKSNETKEILHQRPSNKVPARSRSKKLWGSLAVEGSFAKSSHVLDDAGEAIEDDKRSHAALQQLSNMGLTDSACGVDDCCHLAGNSQEIEGCIDSDEVCGPTEEQEKDQQSQSGIHTKRRRQRDARRLLSITHNPASVAKVGGERPTKVEKRAAKRSLRHELGY